MCCGDLIFLRLYGVPNCDSVRADRDFLLQDETMAVGCVLEQGTFEDCGKYMSG